MGLFFNNRRIREFIDEIRNFKTNLVQFDVERVKREATKAFAVEMTKQVTQTLRSHPDINAPATEGPFDSGPGPSISTKKAWRVRQVGNYYTVRPHPQVEQRAIVLNDGYGTITPDGDAPMTFNVNGFPISQWEVEGPDETQYWQTAFTRLIQSGKDRRIAKKELQEEANRAFNEPTNVIKE